jgi:pilus assembly protein CpaE
MPETPQKPGQILWVTTDVHPEHRELIQATGREFQMEVHFCSHDEFNDLASARRWKLVGVELSENSKEDINRIKALHQRLPNLIIFVVSADQSINTMRTVLAAGATDFLSLPLNAAELGKALLKFTQKVVATPTNEINGEVIAIYGARGGLGTTTLTVNLAVKMASLTDTKIGIIDLDLQRGDVATFLNLATTQSLASMASATGDIDHLFLESVLTRHPSGVHVLPAPQDLEEADLVTREHVMAAVELLRSQFRYSLIDTPRMLTDATLAAFEQCDRILLLTDLSIPGIRAGQRIVDLLTRVDIAADRVELLLTVPAKSEVKVDDATKAIGRAPMVILPRDDAAATEAMNAGAPLNGTRDSVLSQAILELASKLTGTGPKKESGPLLRRLLGLGRSS